MSMNARNALVTLAAAWLGILGGTACTGDDGGSAQPVPMGDDTGMLPPPMTGSTGGSGTADSTGGTFTADSTTGEPLLNCDQIECIGNGSCQIGEGGAYCQCDFGYAIDDDGDECLIDRSCMQVRVLEDRCRQIFNGPPAVSMFFGLDFCAGTAVTPEWVEQLGVEFVVLENGVDISKNVESEAAVIDKDVESFVTLVLDMSDSVAESQDLPELVSALRNMVSSLEPAGGEPPVAVSVYVFGRFVEELQPFTRDFAAVDATLAGIEADPEAITALVNGNGTSLYEAVRVGINRTQRIRDLRAAVTWDGVLSTGSVVVVTDGNDTSNGDLETALINNTLNQVISIGISDSVDDEDLTAIGRDGSFLAPSPDNWVDAFNDIASRVDEYPDRAYLLAYCSSATEGNAEVTVTVDGPGIQVAQDTTCNFIPDAFGTDAGDVCTGATFTDECRGRECGGLTACGACADDECCDGASCTAPSVIEVGGHSCAGADQFCAAAGEICVPGGGGSPDTCEPPDVIGGNCDPGCESGAAWCLEGEMPEDDTCQPAFGLDIACDSAAECQSQNCQPANPDNPFELPTCQPEALLFDRCDNTDTVCEAGGYCQGSECLPQRFNPQSCSGSVQCRSGLCTQPVATNICVPTGLCYWPWSDKLPA